MARNAFFDMLRQKESLARSQRRVVQWISCGIEGVYTIFCESQDSYPKKSILREPGMLGSKHTVKFSQGTWHQIKIRERKGPSRGIIQKCAPHERSPCAPKFEDQERCARKAAYHSAKKFTSSRIRTKLRFMFLVR